MKKLFFTVLLISTGLSTSAQPWHWINPSTGLQKINDIRFVSPDEGMAVGDFGAILHYQDGDWTIAESPVTTTLNAVEFINPNLAWAVGNAGVILKYNGSNWQEVSSPITGYLKDICYVDETHSWAVGSAILFYDGASWQVQAEISWLETVGFLSANEGWAGSSNNNFIHYTNGGWVLDETFVNANPMVITSIEKAGEGRLLLNGQDIEIVGVLYENTGQGWQQIDDGNINDGISFYDAVNGFGIEHAGFMNFDLLPTIRHFSNNEWSTEYTFEKRDQLFSSLEALTGNEAMAGDVLGYIHHGSGGNWGLSNGFMCDSILDVDFVAANKGFLAADNTGIWKYDAGEWSNIFDAPGYTFNEIDFHADYWGYAAAYTTYNELPPPFNCEVKLYEFYQGVFSEINLPGSGFTTPISSINDYPGELIISSYNEIFTKTDNDWIIETLIATDSISEIRFQEPIPIENQIGGGGWEAAWLCAKRTISETGGVIYYKDYMNNDWQQVYQTYAGSFNDLCISDYYQVYAVGTNGLIAYFDGTEWMEEVPITNEDLLSVYVNENHDGWAVGKNGTILRCNNGDWSVYTSPLTHHLNKVSFYKNDLGFIVGNEGAFLSTKAKLPVGILNTPVSNSNSLHIYPNPAGDYFFVEIPQPTSSLQVSITDMMGRVVYAKDFQTQGIVDPLRINSERFSPGIYLIKIMKERELLTGKIIKN